MRKNLLLAIPDTLKDHPPNYSAEHERTFTFREIFFGHVFNNKLL